MLNIFQAFRNWLEYYILFSLACYPFAAYLNYFLPFIDSDGSKFPWLCFFHISSKGPFSFWVGSDLQLSVLSPSVCSQTCKRHYWNPYQTASLSDRGLPKSSTKLDFLTDPLPLSLLKKKKKTQEICHCLSGWSRKKMFSPVALSLCMRLFSLSLHFTYKLWETEIVILICIFQCLQHQLMTRAWGITVYINSSNKINMMAIPKPWLEKNYLVTSLFWTFIHSRSTRSKSGAFSVKCLNLS